MGTYKPGESLPAQKRIKKRKGPDSASIDRVSHFRPVLQAEIIILLRPGPCREDSVCEHCNGRILSTLRCSLQ